MSTPKIAKAGERTHDSVDRSLAFNLQSRTSYPEFRQEIATNIKKAVAQLKRGGTVGMGWKNLLMVTPTPKNTAGPTGTNVEWIYEQMFREVLNTLKLRNFNVLGL